MKKIGLLLLITLTVMSCSKLNKKDIKNISLFQFASRLTVDESAKGVQKALKDAGYIDGENCKISLYNAQNDFSTAQLIAQKLASEKNDIIITLTTPCLQVTANANKRTPHVFGMVTDPFRMGVAEDCDHHIPNITGVATFQPVESAVKLIKEILPNVKKIGVVWNPTEACSEACTEKMRVSTKKLKIELVEMTVTNSMEVQMATQSLLGKGIDAILISGDNTVELAIDAVITEATAQKIPVFTNNPPQTTKGALLAVGADYYTVGIETGKLAVRVLKGEKASDLPIQKSVPEKLWINQKIATQLNISVPQPILSRADNIIEK